MVLKCSYLSQKIKLEKALDKPMVSIVESILIWVHHHPYGGLALRIRRCGLSTWTRLDMSIVGRTTPMGEVLYSVTLIVQGQWLYTWDWIWSGRIAPRRPTCIVHGPNKRHVDLVFMVKIGILIWEGL